MGTFNGKFNSAKQDWQTPDEIFDPLNEEFAFTLDAAASFENKRAEKFFDKDSDGLLQDWGLETVWLNPPYGDGAAKLSEWVEKSYRASLRGATVVMLLPARTNTNWFHDLCLSKAEIRFIRGRPRFGKAEHGLPQPLCIIIFRPRIGSFEPRLSRKAFANADQLSFVDLSDDD
jgi:site-specific DNA-methyltransferase (adenine-specific)